MQRSPADRSVVAVKPLLSGGGSGAKGPAHQECGFDQPGTPREEERKHANVASQAVRYSQATSVGGVQAGCGQQGCPGSGQRDPGRLRVRSEEQFVQDLEPDELWVLLSASGACCRDTEAPWGWCPFVRCAHNRRPNCPNGGGHASRGKGGTTVPPRLLWLPAEEGSMGCGRGVPTAVLEEGLGHRSRCPKVLRFGALGPHRQSGRGCHRHCLGAALCEAVARCPAAVFR